MKKIFNRQLIKKYIISYISFFLIPLIMFFLVYFSIIQNTLYNEMLQDSKLTVQRQQDIWNSNDILHLSLVSSINHDARIGLLNFVNSPISQLDVINSLSLLEYSDAQQRTVFLYYKKEDQYLTPDTSCFGYQSLIEQYDISEESMIMLYNALHTATDTGAMSEISLNNKAVVPFIYDINPYQQIKAIIFVDVESIFASNNNFGDFTIQYIFDENNNLISSYNSGVNISDSEVIPYVLSTDLQNISVNNMNFSVLKATLNDNYTYIYLIDESYIMQSMDEISLAIFIMIVSSALLFIIVLLFNLKWHYSPINSLWKLSDTILNSYNEIGDTEGGIEVIEKAITTLQADTIDLKEQNVHMYNKIGEAGKYYFLRTLLDTDYAEPNVQNLMKELGISFKYNNFAVVTVHIDCLVNRKQYMLLIADLISKEASCFYSTEEFNKKFIFLVNFAESESFEKKFSDVLTEACISLKQTFDVSAVVGVSKFFNSLSNVSSAFVEADIALDYRLIYGKQTVIFSKNIVNNKYSVKPYPFEELDKMEQLLYSGTVEQVKMQIDIVFTIINQNTPLYFAKRLAYDIVSILSKCISSLNNITNVESIAYFISNFNSIEQLKENVVLIVEDMFKEYKENSTYSTGYNILQYVNERVYDVEFSVTNLANDFSISAPLASMTFKKFQGETLMNYITKKRMEKAKELLLLQSGKTYDIAKQVGFENITSFNRRFKQYFGMTPSQMIASTNNS